MPPMDQEPKVAYYNTEIVTCCNGVGVAFGEIGRDSEATIPERVAYQDRVCSLSPLDASSNAA